MEYHYDCYKTPGKTSASTAVRRLALWAELYQKAYALFTFITRSARLNKQRSGDFRLFPPANFANSAILPTDKISAFFMQNFLLQKPKDSSLQCPSVPTGEEWSPSLPQCGVDRHPSWPERFQLRWHLRLRLGNVSKLPFLSACT